MKKNFKLIELIGRIPFIILWLYVIFRCIIDLSGRGDTLLLMSLAAIAWESILFICVRLKLFNLKSWEDKDHENI